MSWLSSAHGERKVTVWCSRELIQCSIPQVVILAVAVVACKAAPQFAHPPQALLEFGVDDHGCTVAATGVVCPWGPVQFLGEAKGVDKPWFPPATQRPYQQHHSVQQHHQAAFTGLVGPSGVIGPSGLVGPSGPVAFGR